MVQKPRRTIRKRRLMIQEPRLTIQKRRLILQKPRKMVQTQTPWVTIQQPRLTVSLTMLPPPAPRFLVGCSSSYMRLAPTPHDASPSLVQALPVRLAAKTRVLCRGIERMRGVYGHTYDSGH